MTSLPTNWANRILWITEHFEDGNRRRLGRRLNLSGQAVSAWTRGQTVPSGQALATILDTYPDLNARWLLTGRGEPLAPRAAGEEDAGAVPSEISPECAEQVARAHRAGRVQAYREIREMLGDFLDRQSVNGGSASAESPEAGE